MTPADSEPISTGPYAEVTCRPAAADPDAGGCAEPRRLDRNVFPLRRTHDFQLRVG